jgi:hypothetical protein
MWGRHRNLRAAILYGLRAAHWVYENAVSFIKRGRNATNSCLRIRYLQQSIFESHQWLTIILL